MSHRPHLHFTSLTPRELCGDIVESYRLAAERLGYPTSYADRSFLPGTINVLFFFWDVPWETIAPYHPDCIVVNFEPMVPGTHAWRDNYLGVLKQCYLWEYSQSNFQRDRELGLHAADYVPLGYEEGAAPVLPLADILPDAEQDIDVVFFGTMTQRRVDVLDALMRRGLRVQITNGGQGWTLEERDGYLRRAKVALNFHNWGDSRVVEIGRLSILFRQRKAVVCELYPDSEVAPALREAVAGAPYEALVDTVLALLSDAPRRAALERKGLDLLRQREQRQWVGPALERYLQWRSQQQPLAIDTHTQRVSVCLTVQASSTPARWNATRDALAQQTQAALEVLLFAQQGAPAQGTELDNLRLLDRPTVFDPAAARNAALQCMQGEWVVFLAPGDTATPERLARQSAFLAAHPDIDILGSWCAPVREGEAPLRCAELDHEIKADLLGQQPLRLRSCMFRRRFLEDTGLRFDAEFVVDGELHFLCKCAAAGARFAALPLALHAQPPEDAPPDPLGAARLSRLAAQARLPLLAPLFPHWTHDDLQHAAQLHARAWPADLGFAGRMLAVLAGGCAGPAGALGTEPETVARVLRREAQRLIRVFFEAGLADQGWIDQQFRVPEIAAFLAPISPGLPLRPSAVL